MGRSSEETRALVVDRGEDGERLDRWLADRSPGASRADVQRWIDAGSVLVNGVRPIKRRPVRTGDRIEVRRPVERDEPSPVAHPEILYEDDAVLVVRKPPHQVVHPARPADRGTLVHALRAYTDRLSTCGGEDRPGIVHRLDKGTSGILVVARTDEAHRRLAAQFKARTVDKEYVAVVWGAMECLAGTISAPLGRHRRHRQKMSVRCEGGREADTDYRVETRGRRVSVVRLKPGSGRTHQLRVHLAYVGHPVFGDPAYGGRRVPGRLTARERERFDALLKVCRRQALHAETLAFDHPVTGRRRRFRAAVPDDMDTVLQALLADRADEEDDRS